jgi:phosphoribosyl-ATP pyrophosphohydrolase/phosphoribosyl-AMP cyclohydrolase/histidinol dehydrogenase
MTDTTLLPIRSADDITCARRPAYTAEARAAAESIVRDVASRGVPAVIEHATRLGDLRSGQQLIYTRQDLRSALDRLDRGVRRILEQARDRIASFAAAQRAALRDIDVPVPGGRAGHRFIPVSAAGCYAPGGRYPLPSSVLMTAVTARSAGVQSVWVASPRPAPATLAAAALSGADALLAVGGAQAIAALAFGMNELPPCDTVVGPGNAYVTAAKHAVSDRVRIDMLAGPSEVLIITDDSADPALVAADLLAQAEHDDDAIPLLVTTSSALVGRVELELIAQLETLPTAATARRALRNAAACVVASLDDAAALADRLAPEHLQLMTREDERLASLVRNYGALFIGARSAETIGDYGIGPNHTLPTGGTARWAGGLSVMTFLTVRTWLKLDAAAPAALYSDTADFARIEGLEAHARAALRRISPR